MYEASLRMPFLVRWPGVIKPGTVQEAMAINLDFAPTFMDMAGLPVPADMQGRSLLPLLQRRAPGGLADELCTTATTTTRATTTRAPITASAPTDAQADLLLEEGPVGVYDLVKDPHELHNLYNDPAQATVAALKRDLWRLKKALKDEDRFANELPQDSSYVQAPPLKKR